MKIVNATWELKNLGKRTVELTLENEDCAQNSEEVLRNVISIRENYDAEYLVVKIPAGYPWAGDAFCKNGFVRIETQLHLQATREDVKPNLEKYKRFFRKTVAEEIKNPEDFAYVKKEISRGVFFTDRVALDPEFGVEIANRRYTNWIEDELQRGGKLYCISENDNKLGFSLQRYDGNSVFALLAGLFKKYQGRGLGGKIYLTKLARDYSEGYEKFYTAVSSNNISVLKIHESTGYKVSSLQDVYVKHYASGGDSLVTLILTIYFIGILQGDTWSILFYFPPCKKIFRREMK